MVFVDEHGNELDIDQIPHSPLCPSCTHCNSMDEIQRLCCIGVRFKHMDDPDYECRMYNALTPLRVKTPARRVA